MYGAWDNLNIYKNVTARKIFKNDPQFIMKSLLVFETSLDLVISVSLLESIFSQKKK